MPTKKIVLSRDTTLLTILENSFFQREGFEMVEVQADRTGYETVEAEAPTLAIFDLKTLGDQALQCCQSIKQDPLLLTTPILLVLPANSPENLADRCWDAGCDAVVYRPLTTEHFLEVTCGLLGISRRLARRFPVFFHLEFTDDAYDTHIGSCLNLNVGGMFLATERLFPVETQLDIEFLLPGQEVKLRSPARVAWVNHPEWRKKNSMPIGMGVQFLDVTKEFRETLMSYVKSLSIEG